MESEKSDEGFSVYLPDMSAISIRECESNEEKQRFPFVLPPLYKPANVFSVGDVILERYEVKERLHGNMGEVYRCYDRFLRDDVAMKTLISDGRDNRRKFEYFMEEVQERMHIDYHPNVTSLMLVENIQGYPYIISEWVKGDPHYGNSFEGWMNSYSFQTEEIVDFMLQVCKGLEHCCKQLSKGGKRFVLGDLKPENILVTEDRTYKLMDFSTHSYTAAWASPEQKNGEELDERSDIYTLGMIAFCLLKQEEPGASGNSLETRVRELVGRCMEPAPKDRFTSYKELQDALKECCREFQIPEHKNKIQYRTFLDNLYRTYSEINMGWANPCAGTLFNASYAMSRAKNYLSMREYMEYARNEDRDIYEAEAARQRGDAREALEILSRSYASGKRTPKFFFIRGLAYYSLHDFPAAIREFELSSEKELFLPALDIMADLLLQNPVLYSEPGRQGNVKIILDKMGRDHQKNVAGYLFNQVYGKFLMLIGDYKAASQAFQESLGYPNVMEWITLYYFGICEYRQKNIYTAEAVFLSAAQMITGDANYQADKRKAVTLLFCWFTLGNESKTAELISVIHEKYGDNYQYLLESVRHDLNIVHTCFKNVQEAESRYKDNPEVLISELRRLKMDLKQKNLIYSDLQMREIMMTICSREIAILFNHRNYQEAIGICDEAMEYDHCSPLMLQNKGACLFMAGDADGAVKYYELAAFYDLSS
ncbi:protein kinase [Lachnospiraceae bacterium 48-21]